MTNKLANFFVSIFSFLGTSLLGKNLTIFLISMLPILELRGGMIGACLLGLNPYISLLVCWFKKKKFLRGFANWCEKHAQKNFGKIDALKYYGLFVFVAIPLPTTGAWTGCLIASLLGLDKKKSMLAAIAGVLVAGLIMLVVSYGVLGGLCQ